MKEDAKIETITLSLPKRMQSAFIEAKYDYIQNLMHQIYRVLKEKKSEDYDQIKRLDI